MEEKEDLTEEEKIEENEES